MCVDINNLQVDTISKSKITNILCFCQYKSDKTINIRESTIPYIVSIR